MKTLTETHISILQELVEICDHASLTGSLAQGRETVVARYNSAVNHLVTNQDVPAEMFQPLGPETGIDQVGVEARLLLAATRETNRSPEEFDLQTLTALAPFTRGEDLAQLIHKFVDSGRPAPVHVLTGLAPFLRSEDLHLLLERALEPPTAVVPQGDHKAMMDSSLDTEERLAAAERLLRLHGEHLD